MLRKVILAAATVACSTFSAFPAWAVPAHLVILHTNDTHNHLLPFDDRGAKNIGGIARRAALVKQIRAKENLLLFDAGDIFQGTPSYTFFKGEADFKAMDKMGYDAVTIGNHDLDDGPRNLLEQWKGHAFSIINSNLLQNGKPLGLQSKVYSISGLKVGVFGLIGEDSIGTVSEKNRQSLVFKNPASVAREMVKKLNREADIVVLLSHSGYQEDKKLAQEVPGIDLIVGGHSHTLLEKAETVENAEGKTFIVQDGQWGEQVGRLDLEVENGEILSCQEKLMPIDASITPDPEVAALVEPYEAKIKAKMGEAIAISKSGLSRENSYKGQCPLGSWGTDLVREVSGADIGILNSGGLRADLPAGAITVGDVYKTFPFDNELVTLDVSGTVLQEILDANAALISEKGVLLQFSGLSWKAKNGKATVSIGGKPIDPLKTYRIATIDYIAQGNDRQKTFQKGKNYHKTGQWLRDSVVDYLRKHPSAEAPNDPRFENLDALQKVGK